MYSNSNSSNVIVFQQRKMICSHICFLFYSSRIFLHFIENVKINLFKICVLMVFSTSLFCLKKKPRICCSYKRESYLLLILRSASKWISTFVERAIMDRCRVKENHNKYKLPDINADTHSIRSRRKKPNKMNIYLRFSLFLSFLCRCFFFWLIHL